MEQTYLSKRYNYLNARIAQKNKLIHKLRQEVDYWKSENKKLRKKIEPLDAEFTKPDRNVFYQMVIHRVTEAIKSEYPGFSDRVYNTPSRVREICVQRQIFQYFLMKKGLTSTFIGQITSRDHSSVLNSVKIINDLTDTDITFRRRIERIALKLNSLEK